MNEIDYMYEVYLQKSFSKAAQNLFITQPALSSAVKKVEENLGVPVFDRSSSPISLTEEGKIYIAAVEEIRAAERNMREQLSDIAELRTGHIKVSGENFVSSFILPPVLTRFSEKYSGIDVELVESNSPGLKQLLLTEAIDLMISHDFDAKLYNAEPLFNEIVLLAVPENSPIIDILPNKPMTVKDIIAGKHKKRSAHPIDLSLLADEEFLILKPGNDMHKRANVLCAEAGFSPKIRISLDQLITSYNLARAGLGVAFVTDVLVEQAQGGGCVFYRLGGDNAIRTMAIGYKKNRYLSRAASAFLSVAKDVFAEWG